MKKTLLFVTILLSLFSQGMKADEYSTIIEQMIREGVVAGMGDMSQVQQMKTLMPKFAEYYNGQFITDMAELMAPYYRENCTIDDMKQIKDYLTSPEMKASMKNMVEKMQSSQAEMQQETLSEVQTIMAGGTPDDVKPLECSKEYAEVLDKLFDNMSYEKYAKGNSEMMSHIVIKTIQPAISTLADKMGHTSEADKAEMDSFMVQMEGLAKKYDEYYGKNFLTIIRNFYIKSVPLEDIQKALNIQAQPFFSAYKHANEAMYEDWSTLTDKMIDLMMPYATQSFEEMMDKLDTEEELPNEEDE